MIGIVAIVKFWEHELKNQADELILFYFLVFLLKLEDVVKWMIEVDVSLQDFVTFDIELILLERSDSVVVQNLLVFDNLFFSDVIIDEIIDQYPFK